MSINRDPVRGRRKAKVQERKGLGIKGRLMLSFGLVALTTVLAGGIGILSYGSIQSASLKVTDESVPAMAKAFQMVDQATALRSLASSMAGSTTETSYEAANVQVMSRKKALDETLAEISGSAIPKDKIDAISVLKDDLFTSLHELSSHVSQRHDLAKQRDVAVDDVAGSHRRLIDWLTPQIDDAGFELVIETEGTTESLGSQIESLMTNGVSRLQSALTLRAEANLAAGILIEAAVAPDRGSLEATADRFTAAKAAIEEQMTSLSGDAGIEGLQEPVQTLLQLGDGDEGIFPARRAAFENEFSTGQVDALTWIRQIYGPREAILQALEPAVDEASFDLVILSESAVSDNANVINKLINHSVGNLQGLLGIASDANWLAGLLHQASMEPDAVILGPLNEQINAAIEHLSTYEEMLSLSDDVREELDALVAPLLMYASGPEAIIDLRAIELDTLDRQRAAMHLTEDIAASLTHAVDEIVKLAHVDVQESSHAVHDAIVSGRWLLIGLSLTSLLIAVAVVAFYVGPKIVAPLGDISRSVGRLALGEHVAVPGVDRPDELGDLARSLGIIHDRAIEATRIKLALDSADSPIMVTDADHKVIYVNPRLDQMFRLAETDICREVPEFAADDIVGGTLDFVYRLKSQFSEIIDRLKTTHYESIKIGERHLSFATSPVKGPDGSRLGSVLQWQDETEERRLRQAIGAVVQAASAGDFSKRIEAVDGEGTMADLASGINELAALIQGVTTDLGQMLASLANGDLTQRIANDYQGTLGNLKENANRTADQLGDIVAQIQNATSEVGNAASEIRSGTSDLSERTEQAAANLEETAASTEEMAATVRQNADNAKSASELVDAASDAAATGGGIVKQAVAAMSDIEESAQKIGDIIGVIDEIAFQTNLLALNASVEAARAGEAGKGFAVVAQEVRQLAQRSANAASDIKVLIQHSNGQVNDGVRLVNQTGEALGEIVGAVEKVTSIVGNIANASQEQALGVQEINQSISSMDDMTQQNSALVEESTAAAQALKEQTGKLTELMIYFKVDGEASKGRATTQLRKDHHVSSEESAAA